MMKNDKNVRNGIPSTEEAVVYCNEKLNPNLYEGKLREVLEKPTDVTGGGAKYLFLRTDKKDIESLVRQGENCAANMGDPSPQLILNEYWESAWDYLPDFPNEEYTHAEEIQRRTGRSLPPIPDYIHQSLNNFGEKLNNINQSIGYSGQELLSWIITAMLSLGGTIILGVWCCRRSRAALRNGRQQEVTRSPDDSQENREAAPTSQGPIDPAADGQNAVLNGIIEEAAPILEDPIGPAVDGQNVALNRIFSSSSSNNGPPTLTPPDDQTTTTSIENLIAGDNVDDNRGNPADPLPDTEGGSQNNHNVIHEGFMTDRNRSTSDRTNPRGIASGVVEEEKIPPVSENRFTIEDHRLRASSDNASNPEESLEGVSMDGLDKKTDSTNYNRSQQQSASNETKSDVSGSERTSSTVSFENLPSQGAELVEDFQPPLDQDKQQLESQSLASLDQQPSVAEIPSNVADKLTEDLSSTGSPGPLGTILPGPDYDDIDAELISIFRGRG